MHLTGGGLAAAVVVVVIARLLGYDITGLLSGGPDRPAPASSRPHPPAGADPDKELVGFVKFVMKDVQDTFEARFAAQGRSYRHAKLYLFTDTIDTGCGRSSSAIGPFYCPADEHAYIDLSFYRELRQRFGAPGDFAQAYVLAHEIGHHLQKLMGTEPRAEALGRGRKRNEISVRTELQADCYAGVWGHAAAGKKLLEAGDLEEALTAATAIGDDRLQRQAGRQVNPETFTHGSSAQRVRWFRKGFDSGRLDACDTFSAPQL
jgi:predicted metalloprotease